MLTAHDPRGVLISIVKLVEMPPHERPTQFSCAEPTDGGALCRAPAYAKALESDLVTPHFAVRPPGHARGCRYAPVERPREPTVTDGAQERSRPHVDIVLSLGPVADAPVNDGPTPTPARPGDAQPHTARTQIARGSSRSRRIGLADALRMLRGKGFDADAMVHLPDGRTLPWATYFQPAGAVTVTDEPRAYWGQVSDVEGPNEHGTFVVVAKRDPEAPDSLRHARLFVPEGPRSAEVGALEPAKRNIWFITAPTWRYGMQGQRYLFQARPDDLVFQQRRGRRRPEPTTGAEAS